MAYKARTHALLLVVQMREKARASLTCLCAHVCVYTPVPLSHTYTQRGGKWRWRRKGAGKNKRMSERAREEGAITSRAARMRVTVQRRELHLDANVRTYVLRTMRTNVHTPGRFRASQ